MSATAGGASFDLQVLLARYRAQLQEARQEARTAAEDIQRSLSGAGAAGGTTSGGNTAEQTRRYNELGAELAKVRQELAQTQAEARSASSAFETLKQSVDAAAAANAQLAATAAQAGRQQSQAITQAAQAAVTAQGAIAQSAQQTSSVVTTAATQQGQSQAQAIARADQLTRAYVASERAYTALVTAFQRSGVEVGKTNVDGAIVDTQEALAALEQSDPDRALLRVRNAAQQVREGIRSVNAEIREFTSGNKGLNDAQQQIDKIADEIARLRGAGVADTDAQLQFLARQQGTLFQNLISGSGGEGEGEALANLNRQATTLNTTLTALTATEKELTAADRQAAIAADREAEAVARRQKAEIERERARQDAILNRAIANQNEASTSAGTALTPFFQNNLDPTQPLVDAGLRAEQATKAIDGTRAALVDISRAAQGTGKVAEGFDQIGQAAGLARSSIAAMGRGDTLRALETNRAATLELRDAQLQLAAAETRAHYELEQGLTPALEARLGAIATQTQRVQAAINDLAKAERALMSEETEAIGRANASALLADRLAKQLAREELIQSNTRFRQANNASFTIGDLFRGVGAGQAGQAVGGAVRGGALLEQLGFATSLAPAIALTAAVTALGAAITTTVKSGFEFNEFLGVTAIRMEAATGSAVKAQESIQKLLSDSRGSRYGFLSTEELASGVELLQRLGLEGEDTQRRIANATAATGRDFSDTATQIAHLYDTVKGGQPIGDMVRALERSGIITAEWGNQLLAAAQSGASVEEQIDLINRALDRFDGSAEKMSKTGAGAFQRLKNEGAQLAGVLTEDVFLPIVQGANVVADALQNRRVQDALRLYLDVSKQFVPGFLGAGLVDKGISTIQSVRNTTVPASNKIEDGPSRAIATRLDQSTAAFVAGQKAVDSYAKGFDADSDKAFIAIQETVERHLKAISGGDISTAQQTILSGTIEPLLAKMVSEIQERGKVTDQTVVEVQNALGSEAEGVIKLAGLYADLRIAAGKAEEAQKAVDSAALQLANTQDTAREILAIDQQSIDAARTVAAEHAQQIADEIQAIRDKIEALDDAQKIADRALAAQIKGLTETKEALQNAARGVAAAFDRQIDGLNETKRGLTDANEQAAESARVTIQAMQDDLSAYQEGIAARRSAAQEEIDSVSERVKALSQAAQDAQNALSEHQAAFNAAINGTVDDFNREHTAQDDITKAIIAKWDAEISGSRRAREEADQRVRQFDNADAETRLAYDRRVQAARDSGNNAQAAALERERDRVLARSRRDSTVARDQAAVAANRERDRIDDAKRAAQQQGSTDTVAVNTATSAVSAAQKELEGLQQVEKERQKAEDAEVERRQKEIAHNQRVEEDRARIAADAIKGIDDQIAGIEREKAAAKSASDFKIALQDGLINAVGKVKSATDEYYADEKEKLSDAIKAVEARGREQKKNDDARIAAAQAQYDADKAYFAQREKGDQLALDNARLIKSQIDDQVTGLSKQISSYDQILARQDQMIAKQYEFLNQLRAALNLPPLEPGSLAPANSPTIPKPPATGPAPNYDPGRNAGDDAGAGTAADRKPLLPGRPGFAPPPGYHQETDNTGTMWYVPDGLHLEDYGKRGNGLSGGSGALTTAGSAGQAAATAAASTFTGTGARPTTWHNFASGGIISEHVVGLGLTTGAGYNIGESGRPELVTPVGERAGSGNTSITGPLISIAQVNASDPGDVDAFIQQAGSALFGVALGALDITRRGGIVRGRERAR